AVPRPPRHSLQQWAWTWTSPPQGPTACLPTRRKGQMRRRLQEGPRYRDAVQAIQRTPTLAMRTDLPLRQSIILQRAHLLGASERRAEGWDSPWRQRAFRQPATGTAR